MAKRALDVRKQHTLDDWLKTPPSLSGVVKDEYKMCVQRLPSKDIYVTCSDIYEHTCRICLKSLITGQMCILLSSSSYVCYSCYKHDRYRFIIYYYFTIRCIEMDDIQTCCDPTFLIASHVFRFFIMNERFSKNSSEVVFNNMINSYYPFLFYLPPLLSLPTTIMKSLIGIRFLWKYTHQSDEIIELTLVTHELMRSKGCVKVSLGDTFKGEFASLLDALIYLNDEYLLCK